MIDVVEVVTCPVIAEYRLHTHTGLDFPLIRLVQAM
jgi:hypothetical protein